eukprot:symbB.v1.2.036714.t1/scaffold5176.1/size30145/3
MRPVPLKFQSVSGESSKQLRLCTWNVLAPSYALHKSFPDVKPETLAADWNVGAGKASRQLTWDEEYLKTSHRQPLLNQVISHLKADALLQLLLEAAASHFGSDKPLALCGDLNMLPWGSGYKLLQTGSLEVPKKFRNVERFLVDRDISKAAKPLRLAFGAPGNGIPLFTCAPAPRDDSYLTELHEDLMTESARFLRDGGGCLKQSWKLRSSYEDVEPGELQGPRNISNSKYGFHGCIDYIWLSPEFHPCQRLQLPTVVDLNQEPGKPLRQLAQLLCDNVLLSSNWLFQKLCQLPT